MAEMNTDLCGGQHAYTWLTPPGERCRPCTKDVQENQVYCAHSDQTVIREGLHFAAAQGLLTEKEQQALERLVWKHRMLLLSGFDGEVFDMVKLYDMNTGRESVSVAHHADYKERAASYGVANPDDVGTAEIEKLALEKQKRHGDIISRIRSMLLDAFRTAHEQNTEAARRVVRDFIESDDVRSILAV